MVISAQTTRICQHILSFIATMNQDIIDSLSDLKILHINYRLLFENIHKNK